jgi:hypothetical protein
VYSTYKEWDPSVAHEGRNIGGFVYQTWIGEIIDIKPLSSKEIFKCSPVDSLLISWRKKVTRKNDDGDGEEDDEVEEAEEEESKLSPWECFRTGFKLQGREVDKIAKETFKEPGK